MFLVNHIRNIFFSGVFFLGGRRFHFVCLILGHISASLMVSNVVGCGPSTRFPLRPVMLTIRRFLGEFDPSVSWSFTLSHMNDRRHEIQ